LKFPTALKFLNEFVNGGSFSRFKKRGYELPEKIVVNSKSAKKR
jgi:hypothetical protein